MIILIMSFYFVTIISIMRQIQSVMAELDKIEEEPLPVTPEDLLAYFEKIDVSVNLYEHERVFTVSESQHLKKNIPGLHCRNLFLRDKKKKNYLVVAANETSVDLKKLPALIESDRLSFGSADRLWQYLGVRPGSVCPFAIINDKDNEVKIILDKFMMDSEIVCYHPMENNMTVGLSPKDLLKFIDSCEHEPHIVDLAQAAPDKEI